MADLTRALPADVVVREIPLGRSGMVAIVDAADYERVAAHRWYVHRNGRVTYARRRNGPQLHSFLTGWDLVDHADGDGLNNCRSNLRPATRAENARNRRGRAIATSQFKGVSWKRRNSSWAAAIWANGRSRYLGLFSAEVAAARAYDAAAREAFGAFARLNFPDAS